MNKHELKKIILEDKKIYKEKTLIQNVWFKLNSNPKRKFLKYIIFCRKRLFYKEKKQFWYKILFFYYTKKQPPK